MESMNFQVTGGLGNQLFALSAGKWFEVEHNVPVKFFFRDLKGDRFDRVLDFEAALGEIRFTNEPNLPSRALHKISSKFQNDSKFHSRIYDSRVVGFDKDLNSSRQHGFIRGYFQSHIYPDRVFNQPFDLHEILKYPSNWYRGFWNEINQSNFGAIHIRRGDYLKHRESLGVLSESYYQRIIGNPDLAREVDFWLVFSDSKKIEKSFLQNHLDKEVIFVSQPEGSRDVETMAIMSSAQVLVTANSTFSWWAAYFGSLKQIICPSPWYRTATVPEGLIPQHWQLAFASWDH